MNNGSTTHSTAPQHAATHRITWCHSTCIQVQRMLQWRTSTLCFLVASTKFKVVNSIFPFLHVFTLPSPPYSPSFLRITPTHTCIIHKQPLWSFPPPPHLPTHKSTCPPHCVFSCAHSLRTFLFLAHTLFSFTRSRVLLTHSYSVFPVPFGNLKRGEERDLCHGFCDGWEKSRKSSFKLPSGSRNSPSLPPSSSPPSSSSSFHPSPSSAPSPSSPPSPCSPPSPPSAPLSPHHT